MGYALETIAYLLNNVPSKLVSTTLYQIWKGRKPNPKHTKVWACPAYVKRLQTDKLDARSNKCRFIRYPKETMGYYFYHPSDHKVFVSRGGTFLKREFLAEECPCKEIELDEVLENDETPKAQPLRRSSQVHHALERLNLTVQDDTSNEDYHNDDDPKSYEKATRSLHRDKWQEAM